MSLPKQSVRFTKRQRRARFAAACLVQYRAKGYNAHGRQKQWATEANHDAIRRLNGKTVP